MDGLEQIFFFVYLFCMFVVEGKGQRGGRDGGVGVGVGVGVGGM